MFTLAVPLDSANCVRPFDPKLSCTLPSVSPLTVSSGSVTLGTGGDNEPFAEVKLVPTFCQAGSVPVAEELVS